MGTLPLRRSYREDERAKAIGTDKTWRVGSRIELVTFRNTHSGVDAPIDWAITSLESLIAGNSTLDITQGSTLDRTLGSRLVSTLDSTLGSTLDGTLVS